jgi:hypothetical protein
MPWAEAYRSELDRQHSLLETAVADLTEQQWHEIPVGHARLNTIAFEVWHYVRTEDNIIRFALQNRRKPVWLEEGWAERFGLPPIAQGTGMTSDEAHAIRLAEPEAFLEYARAVWRGSAEYLDAVTTERLSEVVTIRPLGDLTVAQALFRPVLTHGYTHLGEIETIRVLFGLPTAIGL